MSSVLSTPPAASSTAQSAANSALWSRRDLVGKYIRRDLAPAEVMLLVHHRDALSGRVLELGCGAGRLTGYLVALAQELHGIDIAPGMVTHCARAFPRARISQRDLRELSGYDGGPFDVVVAGFSVLDVLDDAERRSALEEIRALLASGGLLLMSTHNRADAAQVRDPLRELLDRAQSRDPRRLAGAMLRLPRWLRNRRRLLSFEREEAGYAIRNDISHDYMGLHYYVTRDAQAHQLAEHGFELLECLDWDGRPVESNAEVPGCAELYYAARRAPSPSPVPGGEAPDGGVDDSVLRPISV